MTKKTPALHVVDASTSLPPPPNLGEAGSKLWESINSEYSIDDSGGREMLLQICMACDTAAACAAEIAQDGRLIRTKGGGMRDHPLLKHELAARSFVLRSLHRLGLDIEPTRQQIGRPPGPPRTTR